MKKTQKYLLLFSICLAVIVGCSSGSNTVNDKIPTEPGAEVFVEMNDGCEYEGELLLVNDSTMLLCEVYDAAEQDLVDSTYTIYTLKNYDINVIEIKVDNNAIYGILLGGFTGALFGLAVAKDNSENESKSNENNFSLNFDIGPTDEQKLGCCIGGFIGAAVGGFIAFSISDGEIVYEHADPEEYDFEQLNFYSRYGNKEPVYLKEIK